MGEIETNGDVVAEILAELDRAITALVLAKFSIHRVDPGAFGGSPSGAATRRQVVQAWDGIQETLAMLESVHDEFRTHLRDVHGRLTAVDEEARDTAVRTGQKIQDQTVTWKAGS